MLFLTVLTALIVGIVISIICDIVMYCNFIIIHKSSKFPIFCTQMISGDDDDSITLVTILNQTFLVSIDSIKIIWKRDGCYTDFPVPSTTILSTDEPYLGETQQDNIIESGNDLIHTTQETEKQIKKGENFTKTSLKKKTKNSKKL